MGALEKKVRLIRRIKTLRPEILGDDDYRYSLWQGSNGKYYITETEILWLVDEIGIDIQGGETTIIAGGFDTVEEAEKWFWEEYM